MLYNILLVGLGSAFGGVLRYLISLALLNCSTFPLSTLMVNVLGSFLIGFSSGCISYNVKINMDLVLLFNIGFLGGFTTFSSYVKETILLYESSGIMISLFNVFINNVGGLLMALIGFYIAMGIFNK